MCHFVDLAEQLTQRFRGADYVLKHRVTIDLLSQRDGFVSQAVFGAFTVVDVGSRGIPTNHLTLLISEGVVADQEPTILAVLPERPMLEFERKTTRESSLSLISKLFEVLRMEDSLPKIWRNHIVSSKARIVESRPIGVDR